MDTRHLSLKLVDEHEWLTDETVLAFGFAVRGNLSQCVLPARRTLWNPKDLPSLFLYDPSAPNSPARAPNNSTQFKSGSAKVLHADTAVEVKRLCLSQRHEDIGQTVLEGRLWQFHDLAVGKKFGIVQIRRKLDLSLDAHGDVHVHPIVRAQAGGSSSSTPLDAFVSDSTHMGIDAVEPEIVDLKDEFWKEFQDGLDAVPSVPEPFQHANALTDCFENAASPSNALLTADAIAPPMQLTELIIMEARQFLESINWHALLSNYGLVVAAHAQGRFNVRLVLQHTAAAILPPRISLFDGYDCDVYSRDVTLLQFEDPRHQPPSSSVSTHSFSDEDDHSSHATPSQVAGAATAINRKRGRECRRNCPGLRRGNRLACRNVGLNGESSQPQHHMHHLHHHCPHRRGDRDRGERPRHRQRLDQ